MSDSLKRYQELENWMNACFVQRKLGDLQMKLGELAHAKATVKEALPVVKKSAVWRQRPRH